MRKIIRFVVSFALVISILFSMSSCGVFKEEFTLYGCGSGIAFNRDEKGTYRIEELGLEFKGNTVYLEDYFYSTEFGEKYTIKDQLFKIGDIYLAKKSDYYDDTVHTINIDNYDGDVLSIDSNMYRVHILSNSGQTKELHISVEPREYPLDITFENVNICTKSAIPVFFSKAYTDINIKLIGKNSFTAGSLEQRSESVSEMLSNGLTSMENYFSEAYSDAKDTIMNIPDYVMNNGVVDILSDQLANIGKVSADVFESVLNGWMEMWTGKDGVTGRDGTTCFFHLGAVCFTGDGEIEITGGKGGRGGDAKDSLIGMSNGGDGGKGGVGLACAKFLTFNKSTYINGGEGGEGGDPSDGMYGLFGSSGDRGRKGFDGRSMEVAQPREDK